jgi:hypothetical protein
MRWLPSCLVAVSLCVLCAAAAGAADGAPGPAAPGPPAAPAAECTSRFCLAPAPRQGSLTYRAKVVHNNRSALSYVSGRIDFASGNFEEHVDSSSLLDWKQLPVRMTPSRCALPSIWGAQGHSAQQLGDSLPRFDSPLLRHFITGQLLAAPDAIQPGAQFLAGQLKIGTAKADAWGFEIVASFRGAPLVLVGRSSPDPAGGRPKLHDLAVLGPSSELYQYFFEELAYTDAPLAPLPQLPVLDRARYVSFPAGAAQSVPIRPVKDWLVFQASLPSGRPLNLVFDSGAEQMVIDDLVLKLDSRLEPVGDMAVGGALADSPMRLYEGFDFNVGGVQFKDLSVAGTSLTQLGYGADVRIHGIVGNEILQLCKLDLDLENGMLTLVPPGTAGPASPAGSQELPLTFIRELPHVEAAVHNDKPALLLLDTGQRTPLSVNMDFLEHYKLSDSMKMNGFLGDITGGLLPRYIVENMPLSLGGATYTEKVVDAGADSTFDYGGVPVVGSIGFPLLARHFGGITFDYSRKLLTLREPAENRVFAGRPEAWTVPALRAQAPPPPARDFSAGDQSLPEVQLSRPARALPPPVRSQQLGLDPGGYGSYGGDESAAGLATNPNTPERAALMRAEAAARQAARRGGTDLAEELLRYAEEFGAALPRSLPTPPPALPSDPGPVPAAAPADDQAAAGPAQDPGQAEEPRFRLKPAGSSRPQP